MMESRHIADYVFRHPFAISSIGLGVLGMACFVAGTDGVLSNGCPDYLPSIFERSLEYLRNYGTPNSFSDSVRGLV